MKLDRKFTGTITKVKDGSVVPDDQYVVFLAKDNAFPAALAAYVKECERIGASTEQVLSARALQGRVAQWRHEHQTLCKTPDVGHEEFERLMKDEASSAYKVGDKVRPTKEAWAKEYTTEPPLCTVHQVQDGKLLVDVPEMNYHLLRFEDVEKA
jgi:hypothetical protein